MSKFFKVISDKARGLLNAIYRFPLTVLCLAVAAGIICYIISIEKEPTDQIAKIMFTLIVGAMAGAAAQSAVERFAFGMIKRLIAYAVAVVLAVAYYLIIFSIPEINMQIGVRTIIAVFALLCLFLWFPSFKNKVNFSKIALTHFKNIFIAILFSIVLSAGISAIIGSIHFLLIKDLSFKTYGYANVIIWVLFAPIYYLALLPLFNSENREDIDNTEENSKCPKFLEVLFSYIFVPLLSAFTLVLAAYFIKILIQLKWPVGQLGPMILAYSAVGLIIFILSANLENKFAAFYSKVFPKVLIPVVIMQLISVGIRVNAYGITESRYYVVLFGVFSLVSAVYLSFYRNRNGIIALLVAGFALISVIPPVDAFTVSRNSQINRLESYLTDAGILKDGKLTPKENISDNTKKEVTNILGYLDMRDYTSHITWLPKNFEIYNDMKIIFGFEPYYKDNNFTPNDKSKSAQINGDAAIDVSSCDISKICLFNSFDNNIPNNFELNVKGTIYTLNISKVGDMDALVTIKDKNQNEIISTKLYNTAKKLVKPYNALETLPPEKMTIETKNNGYTLRIIFQNIYISEPNKTANYTFNVLFGTPK